jgi:hypothetical protein
MSRSHVTLHDGCSPPSASRLAPALADSGTELALPIAPYPAELRGGRARGLLTPIATGEWQRNHCAVVTNTYCDDIFRPLGLAASARRGPDELVSKRMKQCARERYAAVQTTSGQLASSLRVFNAHLRQQLCKRSALTHRLQSRAMVHLGLEAVLAGTPATICKTKVRAVWRLPHQWGRATLAQPPLATRCAIELAVGTRSPLPQVVCTLGPKSNTVPVRARGSRQAWRRGEQLVAPHGLFACDCALTARLQWPVCHHMSDCCAIGA